MTIANFFLPFKELVSGFHRTILAKDEYQESLTVRGAVPTLAHYCMMCTLAIISLIIRQYPHTIPEKYIITSNG